MSSLLFLLSFISIIITGTLMKKRKESAQSSRKDGETKEVDAVPLS
jgi:hypothetical protein